MKVVLQIEHGKDASGQKKRAMFATLYTSIEGIDRIDTVSELPDDSVLGKEINFLVTEMLALKQRDIKEKNKDIISKMKQKREKKEKSKAKAKR